MITADFKKTNDILTSVSVTGHAEYAEHGSDIVCAAVTSALQLCANGITQVLKVKAKVKIAKNLVTVTLPKKSASEAVFFLEALLLHLYALEDDYPQNIKVQLMEV